MMPALGQKMRRTRQRALAQGGNFKDKPILSGSPAHATTKAKAFANQGICSMSPDARIAQTATASSTGLHSKEPYQQAARAMPSSCAKSFSSWFHASQRFWFCQCHRPHQQP
jgi:hypothetical protein